MAKRKAESIEKLYNCNKCERGYKRKADLVVHQRKHTNKKPYVCDQCEKAFFQSSHLNTHRRTHSLEKPYVCDKCEYACRTKGNLERHKQRHSDSYEKPYICDECANTFTTKSNLEQHKLIHTGQKSFACDTCSRTFRQRCGLISHQKTHTNQKPYLCDVCEHAFAEKHNLTEHKRIHTKEKPHACNQCGKKFRTSGMLKTHRNSHTGLKPHHCSHCTKTFTTKGHLQKHERNHEEQKSYPYGCVFQDGGTQTWTQGNGIVCSVRTKTERHMEYHIQRNHTAEGIGLKLQSETKLAEFFLSKGQKFERDWANRIDFTTCKDVVTEGACFARPDFYLISQCVRLQAIVLVGNDEFRSHFFSANTHRVQHPFLCSHRQYPCEFQRVFNIANSLERSNGGHFRGVPLLYIRFNPHYYRRDGIYYDPKLEVAHEKLWKTILDLQPSDLKQGVNLVYCNYDETNGNVDVFDKDPDNDYAKLYKPCVIKHV